METSAPRPGSRDERKKLQNRLRQKAWRQRQAAARRSNDHTGTGEVPWTGHGLLVPVNRCDPAARSKDPDHCVAGAPTRRAIPSDAPRPLPNLDNRISTKQHGLTLPADHRLITLVQYNVLRALILNLSILSQTTQQPLADCARTLQIPDLGPPIPADQIPRDLQQTPLQRSTPHPSWIDALPFPQLRDNLILMSGHYAADDLSFDLARGLYEGFDDAERKGFVVWGSAWVGSEWEVSPGFLSKWGFLLRGCADVVEASNRWRGVRGEEALVVEV